MSLEKNTSIGAYVYSGALSRAKRAQRCTIGKKIWLPIHPGSFSSDTMVIAERGAPYLSENGKPSIRENLVMTSPSFRTDFPGRGKSKGIPPLSPREFCPLRFKRL